MHKRSDMSPEKQLIHNGKEWKNIIIGLYFDCVYCKDKYSEYYNNYTVVDPVTICPVCSSAYKKIYSGSCPSCEIVNNWKLLSNEKTCNHVALNNLTEEPTEKQLSHIEFLDGLTKDIIWKWPDENVFVDKKNKCIVWNGNNNNKYDIINFVDEICY